jgi:hypothetical protein
MSRSKLADIDSSEGSLPGFQRATLHHHIGERETFDVFSSYKNASYTGSGPHPYTSPKFSTSSWAPPQHMNLRGTGFGP